MLTDKKPDFEQKLYDALRAAYLTQFSIDPNAGKYNGSAQNAMNEAADKFATKASKPCMEAIYNFVKEIGIIITVPPSIIAPPLPPALPGGPCNGSIPPNNITIM